MKNWIKPISFILVVFYSFTINGQEDLFDLINKKEQPTINYTFATFKNTRLVSGHSVETNANGVLQFLISHRFSRLNSGWRNLFGIDNATMRLGFEYGITDQLNIGIGRSSFGKVYDGTVKWKFLRQKSGAEQFPITATYVGNIYANSQEWADPDRINYFSSRLTFHNTILIGRKFNKHLSLQLMPTMVHRNLVKAIADNNTIYSIGAGGSVRINGSLRANAEYFYIPDGQITSKIGGETVKNSLSIGIDLETGGHVFQLHLTNSRGMTEKYLIGETTGRWLNGDIHFGFNVSRVFTVKQKKEPNKL